jgi:hypothetical protein
VFLGRISIKNESFHSRQVAFQELFPEISDTFPEGIRVEHVSMEVSGFMRALFGHRRCARRSAGGERCVANHGNGGHWVTAVSIYRQ